MQICRIKHLSFDQGNTPIPSLNPRFPAFNRARQERGHLQFHKNTEVLQYYREHKLEFLNLGSVLIGLSDHKMYSFNSVGEVIGMMYRFDA